MTKRKKEFQWGRGFLDGWVSPHHRYVFNPLCFLKKLKDFSNGVVRPGDNFPWLLSPSPMFCDDSPRFDFSSRLVGGALSPPPVLRLDACGRYILGCDGDFTTSTPVSRAFSGFVCCWGDRTTGEFFSNDGVWSIYFRERYIFSFDCM